MAFDYVKKLFSLPSKRLSPPEKVEYKAAANDFTSEGAPPPPKPAAAHGAGAGDPQKKPAAEDSGML